MTDVKKPKNGTERKTFLGKLQECGEINSPEKILRNEFYGINSTELNHSIREGGSEV